MVWQVEQSADYVQRPPMSREERKGKERRKAGSHRCPLRLPLLLGERDLVVVRLTVPTAAADDDEQRSRGWRAGR